MLYEYIKSRFLEPCSYAGIGVILHAFEKIMSNPFNDPLAWSQLGAGIVALLIPNKK